jgi:TM2 domain-containing membrane protein YozV
MAKVCETCGEPLRSEEIEYCPSCGASVPSSYLRSDKNPWAAFALSAFFDGAGQVYNGQLAKGLAILFGTIVGLFLFIVPGVIVWFYGFYDAYRTAKRMNAGETAFREFRRRDMVIFLAIWVIAYMLLFIFAATVAGYLGLPQPGYPLPGLT